jgi:hypothetical protein
MRKTFYVVALAVFVTPCLYVKVLKGRSDKRASHTPDEPVCRD